jgi:diguanylate cyclase (GGDEF)-like protein
MGRASTLLLVSDQLPVHAFFKRALRASYRIVIAEEERSALELLAELPAVIIIDEKTSAAPFLALCRAIRQHPSAEHTPILLLSNNLKKTFTTQALAAGVTDFLLEPLDEGEVFQRLAIAERAEKLQRKVAYLARHIQEHSVPAQPGEILLHRFLLGDKTLKEISKAKKTAVPLSILVVELDQIEALQQTLDEKGMRALLTSLSSLLSSHLRALDTLFPQTPGKYILLLPKTSQSAAQAIAEIIRSAVGSTSFLVQKQPLFITVSIGLTCIDKTLPRTTKAYEAFDLLLDQVDRALTEAKKRGNRIVTQEAL